MKGLANQIAVITAGARGIGRACALRLAEAGCHVAVLDRDGAANDKLADDIRAIGATAWTFQVDMSDVTALERVLTDVRAAAGANPTILVNNAAYLANFEAVLDTTTDDWDRAFATGPTAAFIATRALLPAMVCAGGGSIVNIGSVGGQVAFRRYAAYCSAKAAVIHLARSVAADYGRYGIRANAVLPGAVRTDVTADAMADPRRRLELEAMSPLRRVAEPAEIASVVAFLCSAESSFVTGAAIPVDGGWTAL
jgi:NAD(P)-dependent dehydrogenase (short-subunit alcohol dehydrogenase family)